MHNRPKPALAAGLAVVAATDDGWELKERVKTNKNTHEKNISNVGF